MEFISNFPFLFRRYSEKIRIFTKVTQKIVYLYNNCGINVWFHVKNCKQMIYIFIYIYEIFVYIILGVHAALSTFHIHDQAREAMEILQNRLGIYRIIYMYISVYSYNDMISYIGACRVLCAAYRLPRHLANIHFSLFCNVIVSRSLLSGEYILFFK